ncbi:MAG: glycosyltransferase [Chloroflexi bacterium]|nr:glycosyltransferase [Chloroflexota bacterium]
MKILLAADQYYPPTLGGSAISVRRLAHGLADRGHHVTVLAPASSFADCTEREGGVAVVRCRSVPALHLVKNLDRDRIRVAFLPMSTVRRTIDALRPDVVHIQLPAYIGAMAIKVAEQAGIPVVATFHALPDNPFPARNKRSPVFRLFASKFWETVIALGAHCDAVTAPSRTACHLLEAHGLPHQAIPVSNGVDLRCFRPPEDELERASIRARLGLPQAQPLVLYAGRFAREKRLDLLLQAIPLVRAAVDAHFVLVGTGSSEVMELAETLRVQEHITFTGLLPDDLVPLAYRAVDLFALPSEAELQGMVLLEAAASGLPLVGAASCAIPELVLHGENGFLHRPGDHQDLARQLIAALVDPPARRRFAARSRDVAQAHSFDRTLSRFESLYAELSACVLRKA